MQIIDNVRNITDFEDYYETKKIFKLNYEQLIQRVWIEVKYRLDEDN